MIANNGLPFIHSLFGLKSVFLSRTNILRRLKTEITASIFKKYLKSYDFERVMFDQKDKKYFQNTFRSNSIKLDAGSKNDRNM
jgi:hypothetical protein